MLKIHDLTFQYGRFGKPVLKGLSLTLNRGEIGILLGKNGSGKTTLFKNILGIHKPTGGTIEFEGKNLLHLPGTERAKCIGYVPQEIQFGNLSVFDSVLLGRIAYFHYRAGKEDYEATAGILKDMGLTEFAHRSVEKLSGGERQKVAIARAMAQNPKLMIFDEPTGNLDIANEQLIVEEAKRLAREKNIGILCSLHDLNQAIKFGDKFFFLKDGVIKYGGGKECITEKVIRDIFDIDVRMVNVEGETLIVR